MSYRILSFGLVCVALLVVGCVPAASTRQEEGSATQSAPKTLRMGIRTGDQPDPSTGGIGFNNEEAGHIFHSSLSQYDPTTGALEPRIAERVPTIENGDWRLLPDGSMELTWKVRPNVLWHDGTRLAAEDFVFGFKITMDANVFARGTAVLRSISEVAAPDQQTVVVRWKDIYIYANAMLKDTLVPLPRHLLSDLYDAGDKQAFAASPHWTTQWVGVGPYRLDQWLQGSFIEAVAFDQYFMGRAKVDRISIQFFGDVNTLLAAVLAGDLHVVPNGAFKQEEGHVLRTQWEAKGAGTVLTNSSDLRHGKPSWRYPDAPWVKDVRVRQAMVHLLDRQGMVDNLKYGLSTVGDIPLLAEDPVYRLAQQRGLPSYPYDVNRAHRLLAEAGLSRGSDGFYRSQTGDPFTVQVAATADIASQVQELQVIADQWKAGGLDATPLPIPDVQADRNEVRAKARGVVIRGLGLDYTAFREFATSEISSEATRWRGNNFGAYSNPVVDQMVERLLTTIPAAERTQVGADLVKLGLEEVIWIPLFYGPDVVAAKMGVRGVTRVIPAQDVVSWNVHLWEIA